MSCRFHSLLPLRVFRKNNSTLLSVVCRRTSRRETPTTRSVDCWCSLSFLKIAVCLVPILVVAVQCTSSPNPIFLQTHQWSEPGYWQLLGRPGLQIAFDGGMFPEWFSCWVRQSLSFICCKELFIFIQQPWVVFSQAVVVCNSLRSQRV